MTWGRNDLRRIDLGAKRLGANRLGGETTGYLPNNIFLAKFFFATFSYRLYLCVVMKISKVSHTNFPIFFLQIVSGLMMERTSSLRAKKFGKGYF